MLLARAEIAPDRIVDVRVRGGEIVDVGPTLRPKLDEDVLDARGGAVLPGLHDHHVHLRAQAAAARSVDVAGVSGAVDLRAVLEEAQRELAEGVWLRVVGYHESIAGDLDRDALDDLTLAGAPLRVQHRNGALWVLNSAGVDALGLGSDGTTGVDLATGRVWRRDDLVGRTSMLDPLSLAEVGTAAAERGVTGFTDATPGTTGDHAWRLARDLRDAGVVQTLHLMGPVGATPPDVPRAALGAVKVLLDDHELPPLPRLVQAIRAAHAELRNVAIHCVTRVQLVLAMTALDEAGTTSGDRIEHGSVVPHELIEQVAALRLTVVTQPHFVAERGDDYLRDVDRHDIGSLYRLRSLLTHGVAVAAGTDAPFGSADPWEAMAAAVDRRTPSGRRLGPDEQVDPTTTALGLFLGRADAPAVARLVASGHPADLLVLDAPWRALGDVIRDRPVLATIVGGTPAHLRS